MSDRRQPGDDPDAEPPTAAPDPATPETAATNPAPPETRAERRARMRQVDRTYDPGPYRGAIVMGAAAVLAAVALTMPWVTAFGDPDTSGLRVEGMAGFVAAGALVLLVGALLRRWGGVVLGIAGAMLVAWPALIVALDPGPWIGSTRSGVVVPVRVPPGVAFGPRAGVGVVTTIAAAILGLAGAIWLAVDLLRRRRAGLADAAESA